MQYIFSAIPVAIILGIFYLRSLWFGSRIKKMQQLAGDFNLDFKTNLHNFLGGYGILFLFGKLDEVSGNLGGHNIRIIDGVRWHNKPQGLKNYTQIWIDDKHVSTVISWKKIGSLKEILKQISTGTIPQLSGVDLQGYAIQSMGIIIFGAILLVGLLVWMITLMIQK